jgi:carboxylesterase type B
MSNARRGKRSTLNRRQRLQLSTGNPSAPGLTWPAFSPDRCPTMMFDNDCRMVDDPDAEARKLLLT